ncbi:putative secondary metabolism biosynthetic enzyme [Diatrype stigma]|uniref:Secondary metabolism biosynthetic enzyme n=1 Tax=Diatrype stigma TaxID=117547 RepID=A0AAN9V089_9PEZI
MSNTSLDGDQFFRVLNCVLTGTADGKSRVPTQVVVGAGSGGAAQAARAANANADYYWLRTLSQFAYLQQVDVLASSSSADGSGEEPGAGAGGGLDRLIRQLGQSTSLDAAVELAQEILLERVAKVIVTPVSDIDVSKPVYTYGVDSLVAVELRNWLALELRSDVSIFDLTSSAPITDVCRKIALRSQLVPAALKEEASDG